MHSDRSTERQRHDLCWHEIAVSLLAVGTDLRLLCELLKFVIIIRKANGASFELSIPINDEPIISVKASRTSDHKLRVIVEYEVFYAMWDKGGWHGRSLLGGG
jgi:hypothetical protein